MQVSSAVIPLQSGFDFSFRTCSGGVLLDQKGTSNGYIRLELVPTTVNYSVTPVLFIASHLKMTWSINSIQESVTLGKDLDQNIIYKVQFTAGSGGTNSTLSLTGLASFSVDIPNSILDFTNTGPLFVGSPVSGGGTGFVGCIISGRNIPLVKTVTSACRFVEFETSVIYHVFMDCFGSFLLQAMFLSLLHSMTVDAFPKFLPRFSHICRNIVNKQ